MNNNKNKLWIYKDQKMAENENTNIRHSGGDSSQPEPDVRCGYGSCKPEVLKKLNNSKMMIVIMSFYVFSQGFIVNGIFNVSVSTLERRFGLRSTQIGLVASAYDISAALFGVVISYFGSGGNKPRWLMSSALCMIAGSVIMAIPHFTTPAYEWGEQSSTVVCDVTNDSSIDVSHACVSSHLQNYAWVFAFAMVLFGLGGAVLYTVGTTYIDDSVTALMSPVYMGIFFSFAVLGPGVGYIIGGGFLERYVDFDKIDSKSISLRLEDLRWVGAWWLGPIVSTCMFTVAAVVLSCLGTELPTAKAVRETRVSQMHKGKTTKVEVTPPTRPDIRSLPKVFLALLKNPPFLFTTLAGITETLFLSGYTTFNEKFMRNMFNLSAGKAGKVSGAVVLFAFLGGILFGGFVCRCFKLRVAGMLKLSLGVCAISTLCMGMLLVTCPQQGLAGVTSSYTDSSIADIALKSTCNEGCGCTTDQLRLSCDQNGVQHFSPCFAGCKDSSQDKKTFYNCTCVEQRDAMIVSMNVSMVTSGGCEQQCRLLYVYLPLLFIFMFTTVASQIPSEQAVLRSIDENHRVIMCGTNRFFIRLFGTVPGAIILGAATDAGCLVWKKECGEPSSCWIYDNNIVKRNFFIVGIVTKALSLVFYFCAVWFYKPPKLVEIDVSVGNGNDKDLKDIKQSLTESNDTETDNTDTKI